MYIESNSIDDEGENIDKGLYYVAYNKKVEKAEKEGSDKVTAPLDATTVYTMESKPAAPSAPINVDTSLAPTSIIPTPAAILGEEVRCGAGRLEDNSEKVFVHK